MTPRRIDERGQVGERWCSSCGEEHCLIRWYRAFPAGDEAETSTAPHAATYAAHAWRPEPLATNGVA